MSETSKLTYSQYQQRYKNEHYDTIKVLVPKEKAIKDQIKACAKANGMSINAWLIQIIENAIAEQMH